MTILSIPAWYLTPRPLTDIVEKGLEMRKYLNWNRRQEAVEPAEKMFTAILRVIAAVNLALFCHFTLNLPKGDLKALAITSFLLLGTRLRPSFFFSMSALFSWKCLHWSVNSYYLRQRKLCVVYSLGALAAFCFMQEYKETQRSRESFDLDPKIQQMAQKMARWWVS